MTSPQVLPVQRFGRLTAIEPATSLNGKTRWRCVCDCGNEKVIRASDLRSGRINSCGCLRREVTSMRARNHGLSTDAYGNKPRLYRIWKQMRQRCLNPNDTAYPRYGGRGVTICPEWSDYKSFHDWAVANGYEDRLSIDRRDNDGDYNPTNCRWADNYQQGRNKRNNLCVTHQEETRTVAEWADILGIPMRTLKSRLRLGWSVEDALSTPTRRLDRRCTSQ